MSLSIIYPRFRTLSLVEPHGGEQGTLPDDHNLPLVPGVVSHSLSQQEGTSGGEDSLLAPCGLLSGV